MSRSTVLDKPDSVMGLPQRFPVGTVAASSVVFVLTVAALAIGTALRAWFLFHRPINADEAVTGLMANQILHGHFYAFYWGQPFGGVEPYAVAAVFAIGGQSAFTLDLAPVLLSAISSILVWRIALRFVDDSRLATLAGALAWAASLPALFQSTYEGGYREATLTCGLGAILFSTRILDNKTRPWDFLVLGLLVGIGWWALPEIVYFLIPALVLFAAAVTRHRKKHRAAWWSSRLGLASAAFLLGAMPWIWSNLQSGFASLDSSKFQGAATKLNPGYLGRLRIFFESGLPLQLNLRRLASGGWIFTGPGPPAAHEILLVILMVMLVGAIALCLARADRSLAIALALLSFPFLVALQPATWFWQDGRYLVYFGSLLALATCIACQELGDRIRSGRALGSSEAVSGHRGGSGVWLMSALALISLVMVLVTFHQSSNTGLSSFLSRWGNPDRPAIEAAASLESHGARFGYADYWVAYKLDFVSHKRVTFTVAGVDPNRWNSLSNEVGRSPSPAWLFAPNFPLVSGFYQFGNPVEIQGPSAIPEAFIISKLQEMHIGYTVSTVGGFQVVVPRVAVSPAQLGIG